MLLRRRPTAALAGLAAVVALTGCSAGRTAPVAATPAASTQASSVAATTPAPATTASAADTDPTTPAGARLALAAGSLAGQLVGASSGPRRTVAALPDRAKVATVDKADRRLRLSGLTIVLDPGHNGGNSADPRRLGAPVPAGGFTKPCNTAGTETNAGYSEHAFTFDVVTRAAALLRAQGATVVLTRHDDVSFGPCVDVRAAIANAANADAVVAVHADGAASSAYGFHVIAPSLAPDGGNAKILARSWALAEAVHRAFHSVAGEAYSTYVAGGLVRRSDLAGLNLSRVPAIFIECANMRNAGDASRVSSAAWRERAAAGIVAGVTAFLHR